MNSQFREELSEENEEGLEKENDKESNKENAISHRSERKSIAAQKSSFL